jgi:hypothetical protein
LGGYLQVGAYTGQGPLVQTPGPTSVTLGTAGPNPFASFTGSRSVKAGDFQVDTSIQLQYARYGSFRGSGQGANVSNVGLAMFDVNLAYGPDPWNFNVEAAAWYMRGTPLSGGGWSAQDVKLGLGAGAMYQPGPFGIGVNVLASWEAWSNIGTPAHVAFQFLPTIVSAW